MTKSKEEMYRCPPKEERLDFAVWEDALPITEGGFNSRKANCDAQELVDKAKDYQSRGLMGKFFASHSQRELNLARAYLNLSQMYDDLDDAYVEAQRKKR